MVPRTLGFVALASFVLSSAYAQNPLPRPGFIRGRVLAETGDAVPGLVLITATRIETRADRFVGVSLRGQVNERGDYVIAGVTSGDWLVSAQGTDLSRGTRVRYVRTFYPGVTDVADARPVHVEAGETVVDVDFTLRTPNLHTLQVPIGNLDQIDRAALEITLVGANARSYRRVLGKEIDESGLLVVQNLEPDTYLLWMRAASPRGTLVGSRDVVIAAATVEPMVSLEPAATIGGRVATDDGRAVPPGLRVGARLLVGDAPVQFPTDDAEMLADGRYSIGGLFGRRQIEVAGLPSGWSVRRLVIRGHDEQADTLFDLRSGQTVSDLVVIVGPDR